eukprot:gnl/Trimastix_PCT/514.p2 GENE.gnl/Trimastix_PCT/514~~gnl/Trimastix_PCT/514.p2  ORF type:complete len:577 (+),score=231.77 gnl/Trimastix_PCT/514:61-1731(+)
MAQNYVLPPLANGFTREGKPVLFLILDGYGIGNDASTENPIIAANPQRINAILEEAKTKGLYLPIKAHGSAVGLPSETDMGNSEVGHNAMGAGQIVSQGAKCVNEALESGRFEQTQHWQDTVITTAQANKTVHLFGLLSDGNVHSHIYQIGLVLDGLVRAGIKRIRCHPLLDGRDVGPLTGLTYIDQLEAKLASLREQGVDALIGSGGGRMYCVMDRYGSDWNIVKRGWDAMVRGHVDESEITAQYPGYFRSAREAVESARAAFPEKQDQYNPPFVVVGEDNQPIGTIQDGDAVINWNFRGDRAIQISKAFLYDEFPHFDRVVRPQVHYAGLLEYDTEAHIPPTYLVPPPEINNTMTQYLCASGVTQYAIAETHKFGHVTFFWNGNKSGYTAPELELYEEVPSLPNELTETHPEMKAREVTEKLIQALQSGKYRFLRCNLANGDMVGHTGNFQACVETIRVLDECVGRLADEVARLGGVLVLTADHGNVEDKKGGKTSHTCAPVPLAIVDASYNGEYTVSGEGIDAPGLTNTTATIINLLGLQAPEKYRKSLLRFA